MNVSQTTGKGPSDSNNSDVCSSSVAEDAENGEVAMPESFTSIGGTSTSISELSEAASTAAVRSSRLESGLVRPLYGSYCFSSIPGLIEKTLLGSTKRTCPEWLNATQFGEFEKVLFFFFDAFGWESFERFRGESAALKRFEKEGITLQTTSQFPSTTAVHVTTTTTGHPAYEHEVCGWDYYEPRVGRMIKPLKFLDSTETGGRSLTEHGFSPEHVLPPGDFYPHLKANEVDFHLHGPAAYFPSNHSNRYVPSGSCVGYSSIEQGFDNVYDALRRSNGKSYEYFYIDLYDTACHKFGVGANESDQVALRVLQQLEFFLQKEASPDTLMILSADHGQIADRPGCALLLQDYFPEITRYLKRDKAGEPIRFSGGAKYLFLHVEESALPTVASALQKAFSGAVQVLPTEELAAHGFLGPTPLKPSYLERLGNLSLLPLPGYSVAWYEPPAFNRAELSGHGGASPQEMETPLLILPLCL